jgi:hypothetical protein
VLAEFWGDKTCPRAYKLLASINDGTIDNSWLYFIGQVNFLLGQVKFVELLALGQVSFLKKNLDL